MTYYYIRLPLHVVAQLASGRRRLLEHGASIEPFPQAARRRGELCADAERGLRRVLVLRAPLDGRVEQRRRWLVEAAHARRQQEVAEHAELRRGGLVAAHPAVVREQQRGAAQRACARQRGDEVALPQRDGAQDGGGGDLG